MKVLSNTSVLFSLNNLYGLHNLFLMAHVSAAVFLLSIKWPCSCILLALIAILLEEGLDEGYFECKFCNCETHFVAHCDLKVRIVEI